MWCAVQMCSEQVFKEIICVLFKCVIHRRCDDQVFDRFILWCASFSPQSFRYLLHIYCAYASVYWRKKYKDFFKPRKVMCQSNDSQSLWSFFLFSDKNDLAVKWKLQVWLVRQTKWKSVVQQTGNQIYVSLPFFVIQAQMNHGCMCWCHFDQTGRLPEGRGKKMQSAPPVWPLEGMFSHM